MSSLDGYILAAATGLFVIAGLLDLYRWVRYPERRHRKTTDVEWFCGILIGLGIGVPMIRVLIAAIE
ncbi:hypothetical protein I41_51390 [Lacipirellula limnantheis]|uniref:Uncharacterized protein n=1 Tax=Lacipirellula limnantheis TaxID=2528024 RepID=A0A517U5I1_9BACT|nr:hypothetical protein I41_51390 [Lacipirellula limnantheis]